MGQLYNGQTDKIIEGKFLWSNTQIEENDVSYSNAEVKFEKSLTDRINLLDIYASLKLSFLSGMVSDLSIDICSPILDFCQTNFWYQNWTGQLL